MQTIRILASATAVILAFIGYIPYIWSMIKGRNRPHLFAWTSIFLITCVVGLIQLAGGAGLGAWPTLLGAIVYLVIAVLCLRYGTRDIVPLDALCLGLSLAGLALYVVLRDQPAIALIIVTLAEVVGFLPTWRKTRNDPHSESLLSYYMLVVKLGLVLVATEQYNFLTLANILIWQVVLLAFIGSVLWWRRHRFTLVQN